MADEKKYVLASELEKKLFPELYKKNNTTSNKHSQTNLLDKVFEKI